MLGPDHSAGHALRDGELPRPPADLPQELVDVVILGGGPAGLSAGWRLVRQGLDRFVLLELEEALGGTSRGGSSQVTGFPWGAHYLPVPMPHNRPLIALLEEMNALEGIDERGVPRGSEHLLIREPEERLFEAGYWHLGLVPHASGAEREELARFRRIIDGYVAMRDGSGRRAFAIPVAEGSDDGDLVALERESAADWLRRQGFRGSALRWLAAYACKDDYGLSLEDASAWSLIFYFAARTYRPGEDTMDLLAWPEGNAAVVGHLASTLGDRSRPGWLVQSAALPAEGEERATVMAWSPSARAHRCLRPRRVISALPRFVAQHVVAPLRRQSSPWLSYGSWLVANLHLRSRPVQRGAEAAWDNVLRDSPSLGYVDATHQRGRAFGPTVWTYYYAFTDTDPSRSRERLLEASWRDWADVITADLGRAHPDLLQKADRLDVWRWGHGMVQPRIGQVFDPSRRRAQVPIGPIHFAHSDLSGLALFEEAFHHGVRAADEVLAALAG